MACSIAWIVWRKRSRTPVLPGLQSHQSCLWGLQAYDRELRAAGLLWRHSAKVAVALEVRQEAQEPWEEMHKEMSKYLFWCQEVTWGHGGWKQNKVEGGRGFVAENFYTPLDQNFWVINFRNRKVEMSWRVSLNTHSIKSIMTHLFERLPLWMMISCSSIHVKCDDQVKSHTLFLFNMGMSSGCIFPHITLRETPNWERAAHRWLLPKFQDSIQGLICHHVTAHLPHWLPTAHVHTNIRS